jgi:cell division protein ZapA
MRDIRGKGKVVGVERIAVMTALNLAHDFLQQGCDRDGQQNQVDTRLRSLQEKIEMALNQNAQLEV